MSEAPREAADRPLCIPLGALAAEAAFACFAGDSDLAWLDSQGSIGPRSRYSTLAVSPFAVLDGADPFDALARAWRPRRHGSLGVRPFEGGAVGFLGYEQAAWLEQVPVHRARAGIPGYRIALYDLVLSFDRLQGTACLFSSGLPEPDPRDRTRRARIRADAVLARLADARLSDACPPAWPDVRLDWKADTTRAAHEARVARTIAYIEAGDIYQANIAAAFHASRPVGLRPAAIHMALRAGNPAPFGAYIACGADRAVASVSPERFLSLSADGLVEARPIKGTRPRGDTAEEDAVLAAELLASEKDRAENLMIVDLLRHDLARVAEPGSVRVPELASLESFPRVHHLVSSLQARLRPGADAIDLLRAAFPGGSITGAPKLRAQAIIHELEGVARGPYCGTVFRLGWDGAMDSSIAIRTATITPDRVTIQAGGGIVADSNPADEYEELLVKVRPLLRALGDFPL